MYITIDGFETMTAQQVFDMSASHLLRQGTGSRRDGMCFYNGPEGKTCAAGVFIRPECRHRADAAMASEGDSSWYSLRKLSMVPSEHDDLVSALQTVHDNRSVDRWSEELEKLAIRHGLNTEQLAS